MAKKTAARSTRASRTRKPAGPRAVAARAAEATRPRSAIEAPMAQRLTLSYLNPATNEGIAVDSILLPDEMRTLSTAQLWDRFLLPAMAQIKDRFGR